MKILVGTKNPGKVKGAELAFKHYFNDFEIEGISVNSEVSEQPINDEIYIGAKNRVANLKKYAKENNLKADFYVAIESGMTKRLGNWLIINIAYIEDSNGIKSWGSAPGFPVPKKYLAKIKKTDLATVMDNIFAKKDLRSKNGVIELLTKGVITRIDATEEAFVMALISYINGDLWR